MSRKKFIQSLGAGCKNWYWSWSFVNHNERFVIFGLWDDEIKNGMGRILSNTWEMKRGRVNKGYPQACEHINLVLNEGYDLFTFGMRADHIQSGTNISIKKFDRKIEPKKLVVIDAEYFAVSEDKFGQFENLSIQEPFLIEGKMKSIIVNSYERSRDARIKCLEYHGYDCSVCGFNFYKKYGNIGLKYIHVHHIVPLSKIKEEYSVDPIKDLIPVCPNCHAMIHSGQNDLSIEELKEKLQIAKNTSI